ncbi:MAG: excinuclease ABC subunit C [Spirochaetae bacterium HGW-Spirochaetae-2]|jgi:excinuclease ABC subunit C|nr:MAG: excinuclease ABC subunit C [Spirochaetae bacterium HGW-Spirochaetae-2]
MDRIVPVFLQFHQSEAMLSPMEHTPKEQARFLPHLPGVYLMKDVSGKIIYVGKAKDLRNRVTSYFLSGKDIKTSFLVSKIAIIEYIITGNEYEALVLENNLIKKHTPHYNISLKDGKSYPLIRITNEPFPKVFKTRRIINDGSEYFGPYPDGKSLALYLELIDKMFPLRKCGIPLRKRYSPCLYYHIGRCCGPCADLVTREEYARHIVKVRAFLQGKDDELIRQVREEMLEAAKGQKFEVAAEKRDLLIALESVTKAQQVQDFSVESRDYAACEMRMHLATVSIMQIRDGKLMGKALYRAETFGDETETLLHFLIQYYEDGGNRPQQLYVSHDVDSALIGTYFAEHLELAIEVSVPKEGKHYRVLRMAAENAARDVEKRLKSRENPEALDELMEVLALENPPKRIEGFDIAHLAGKFTVASLITFVDGNPDRKNYRRFNIKSLEGKIDDFASIREAVTRRYTRQVREKQPLPDLIMIDGGKGQVNVAKEALVALGLDDLPVVALAGEYEDIHFPDERPALRLEESSVGLKVLQAVRDETHRFATALNQQQRSREATFILLESIAGVGPSRSKRLMQTFGTLEALLSASAEEIARQAEVPLPVATRILKTLHL